MDNVQESVALLAAVRKLRLPFLRTAPNSAVTATAMVRLLSEGSVRRASSAYRASLAASWSLAPMPEVVVAAAGEKKHGDPSVPRDLIRRATQHRGPCRVIPMAAAHHVHGFQTLFWHDGWACVAVDAKYDALLDDVGDAARFAEVEAALKRFLAGALRCASPRGFVSHPESFAVRVGGSEYQKHCQAFVPHVSAGLAAAAVHGSGDPPFAPTEVADHHVVHYRAGAHDALRTREAKELRAATTSIGKATEVMRDDVDAEGSHFIQESVFGDAACPTFWLRERARHLAGAVRAALTFTLVEPDARRDAMWCHVDLAAIPVQKKEELKKVRGEKRWNGLFEQAIYFDARARGHHVASFADAVEPLVAYGVVGANALRFQAHGHTMGDELRADIDSAQTEQVLTLSNALAARTSMDPVRVQLLRYPTVCPASGSEGPNVMVALDALLRGPETTDVEGIYYAKVRSSDSLGPAYRRLNQINLLFASLSNGWLTPTQAREAALTLFLWTQAQYHVFWDRARALEGSKVLVEERRRFAFAGVREGHVAEMGMSPSMRQSLEERASAAGVEETEVKDGEGYPTSMRRRQQAEAAHRDAIDNVHKRLAPLELSPLDGVRVAIAGTVCETFESTPKSLC